MEGDGGDGGAGHKCRHPHLPVHQVSGNDRCHGIHVQIVGHYSRRNANKQIGSEVSATTTELRWKFLNMNIGRWDDLIVFFFTRKSWSSPSMAIFIVGMLLE